MNMAAVEAEPLSFGRLGEEPAGFEQIGKAGKTVGMGFLDFGDHAEERGDIAEAFLLGGIGEETVIMAVFLHFVVLCIAQERERIGIIADRIGSGVERDIPAVQRGKAAVEQFGMFLFLTGGEQEKALEDEKVFRAALTGGEGIAVARLTFSGKGAHEIDVGEAFFKIYHGDILLYSSSVCARFGAVKHSCAGEAVRMRLREYDRAAAVAYAERWALRRNPDYADFTHLGGDCTNFVSQCLYAGSGVMNEEKDTGWYYRSMSRRAPAWSGVRFLHRFLLRESGAGPAGEEAEERDMRPGDVVFLAAGERLYHSLMVVERGGILRVAAHTTDSWRRPLSDYGYARPVFVRIRGVYR